MAESEFRLLSFGLGHQAAYAVPYRSIVVRHCIFAIGYIIIYYYDFV